MIQQSVEIRQPRDIHREFAPAQHIECQRRGGNVAVYHTDQFATFNARLADVTPLQIARIHHPGFPRDNFARMHMAQRPVVVALGTQHRLIGGRVGIVTGPASERRVEYAEVEQTRHRARIPRRQIR